MSNIRNCKNCSCYEYCQLRAYFNRNEEVACIDYSELKEQNTIINDKGELELL